MNGGKRARAPQGARAFDFGAESDFAPKNFPCVLIAPGAECETSGEGGEFQSCPLERNLEVMVWSKTKTAIASGVVILLAAGTRW